MNSARLRPPSAWQIRPLVARALEEDIGSGDITGDVSIPDDHSSKAVLLAKQGGVFCGGDVFAEVFRTLAPETVVDLCIGEGQDIAPGDHVAYVAGRTRPILSGERVALNFVQRLSGIASLTSSYVERLAGLPARLIDTRKTTPGLRLLEKYAVRAGGGHNHRYGLADAVLLKDNHLAALQQAGMELSAAIRSVKDAVPHTVKVEVEITSLDQLDDVLAGEADGVLLDNMSVDEMREAVARVGGRAFTECSGGVTLETVRAKAETGVDLISVGALTHSASALDLSLNLVQDD